MTEYQTLRDDMDDNKQSHTRSYTGLPTWFLCVIIMFYVGWLGVNVSGVTISTLNYNTTCRADDTILPLGIWLFINSFVGIMSSCVWMITPILILCGCHDRNESILFSTSKYVHTANRRCDICCVLSHLFNVVITVIGIVLLSYHFDRCSRVIPDVTIMILISVVCNSVYFGINLIVVILEHHILKEPFTRCQIIKSIFFFTQY